MTPPEVLQKYDGRHSSEYSRSFPVSYLVVCEPFLLVATILSLYQERSTRDYVGCLLPVSTRNPSVVLTGNKLTSSFEVHVDVFGIHLIVPKTIEVKLYVIQQLRHHPRQR